MKLKIIPASKNISPNITIILKPPEFEELDADVVDPEGDETVLNQEHLAFFNNEGRS